ncbi:MAG: hypothetical protein LAO20_16770 [Acidobacteriia bacterium]|nr:hypothetical protein [Terriglobia bacterium]
MSASPHDVETRKRLRGTILELVNEGHEKQRSRMDHVVLWGVLRKMLFDVGQNDVLTILQDLKERGYLVFQEERNRKTNDLRISQIMITPDGRDLLEGSEDDPAVHVLR